jgi:hypothetical protein
MELICNKLQQANINNNFNHKHTIHTSINNHLLKIRLPNQRLETLLKYHKIALIMGNSSEAKMEDFDS